MPQDPSPTMRTSFSWPALRTSAMSGGEISKYSQPQSSGSLEAAKAHLACLGPYAVVSEYRVLGQVQHSPHIPTMDITAFRKAFFKSFK